jgi:hypothetical protein
MVALGGGMVGGPRRGVAPDSVYLAPIRGPVLSLAKGHVFVVPGILFSDAKLCQERTVLLRITVRS